MGKTREVRLQPVAWSDWQALAGAPRLNSDVLAETLDGGQAFRWHRAEPEVWVGTFGPHLARLSLDAGGTLRWSAPAGRTEATGPALALYFNGARELAELTDSLPWRSDAHLARCLAEFPGLRILRQPFGDTLLCFLCSATKQIVQIKQMVALLAEKHGAPLLAPDALAALPASLGWRLPTWMEIAEIPEADLRACQLGFRARYIHQTSHFLAAHPGWLEATELLPYPEAKARLCSLPGVGEKVADCVLLFGAGKLEAFPVDTWIIKAMAKRYGLENWKPAQVAHFGRTHFGPLAGLAQQYLFSWERAGKKLQAPTSKLR
ncbi:MAG: helix-hairpin-helix motif [Verrucomicrobia bacterium]|nr:helix-hairpin-helix motif [Verrucomicrobiota bacterium]